MKKILIFGGTGFVGTHLVKYLKAEGNYLILATRRKNNLRKKLDKVDRIIAYGDDDYMDFEGISAVDVIINLAGESLLGLRWTREKKRRILESRLKAIKAVEAYAKAQGHKIPLLIQASATGFYGYREDDYAVSEDSPVGEGFLAQTCETMERSVMSLDRYFERIAILRLGIVLGNGGFMTQLLRGFQYPIGVSVGKGQNWFSWIHIQDVVKGIHFIMEKEDLEGVINFTAKESIRFSDFVSIVAGHKKTSILLTIPSFIYKPALGEMADLLTKGIRITPVKLLESGFRYEYNDIEEAIQELCKEISM